MKLFLATMGSRGDFEPFFNLAVAAKAEGHEVIIAVTSEHVEQSKRAGIDVVELQGSFLDFIQDQGVSPTKAFADFKNRIKPLMTKAFQSVVDSVLETRPDFVIYHPKILSAPLAAAKVGAKSVVVELAPLLTPTKEFGAAGLGSGNFGPLNKLTYKLIAQSSSLFKTEVAAIAKTLAVKPRVADFNLCLASPLVVRTPQDWPATTHMVGPWIQKSAGSRESAEVLNFLQQAATAYFGFGSMAMGDAAERTKTAISAARAAGLQALIATGWGGLENLGNEPDVLFVPSVDHAQVFPLVKVAVHHGGAGTVHSALRASTPSVIVPFIADQTWWGARLHRAGLGPKPIPAKKLSEKNLAAALREAEFFQEHVQQVGERMSHEDGVTTTLRLLAELAN